MMASETLDKVATLCPDSISNVRDLGIDMLIGIAILMIIFGCILRSLSFSAFLGQDLALFRL